MDIYLVGGAVRDKLLNYPHHENDWVVVGATPDELIDQGFQPVGKDFPVFLHPDTKEEYALARTERKTGPGYTGFDCHTSPDVTLEDDLKRRDLTINAMAQTTTGELIDPYGGRADIEAKILRHVSPAFVEDPLRVLRVARFAARYAHLGFDVAPETLRLMQSIARGGELNTLPAERVWKELERALAERTPQRFFSVLNACDALEALLPELLTITDTTYAALSQAAKMEQPTTVRFAVLFNDLDTAKAKRVCDHTKTPNEYRHLALLVARFAGLLTQPFASTDAVLEVLMAADAFRKPERFRHFLICGRCLYPYSTAPEQLQRALAACHQVDVQRIIDSGLQGKAIGDELRRQRLAAINPYI